MNPNDNGVTNLSLLTLSSDCRHRSMNQITRACAPAVLSPASTLTPALAARRLLLPFAFHSSSNFLYVCPRGEDLQAACLRRGDTMVICDGPCDWFSFSSHASIAPPLSPSTSLAAPGVCAVSAADMTGTVTAVRGRVSRPSVSVSCGCDRPCRASRDQLLFQFPGSRRGLRPLSGTFWREGGRWEDCRLLLQRERGVCGGIKKISRGTYLNRP